MDNMPVLYLIKYLKHRMKRFEKYRKIPTEQGVYENDIFWRGYELALDRLRIVKSNESKVLIPDEVTNRTIENYCKKDAELALKFSKLKKPITIEAKEPRK